MQERERSLKTMSDPVDTMNNAAPRAAAALCANRELRTPKCSKEQFDLFFGIQLPDNLTGAETSATAHRWDETSVYPPVLECRLGAGKNMRFQVVLAGIFEAASRDVRLREVLEKLGVRASFLASAKLFKSTLLPFLRHVLAHSGTSLDRHHQAVQKKLFQDEPLRIFMSTRSLTAAFTLTWMRVTAFAVAMGLLAVLTVSVDGFWSADLRRYSKDTCTHVRFTALALRNKGKIESPGIFAFGLTRDACHLFDSSLAAPGLMTSSQTASSITMSFTHSVTFDGWFLATSENSTDLDPVIYTVEISSDGNVWQRFASSLRRDRCGKRNELGDPQRGTHLNLLQSPGPHAPVTLDRVTEMEFHFTVLDCLWPFTVISEMQKADALSLAITPILATIAPLFLPLSLQV